MENSEERLFFDLIDPTILTLFHQLAAHALNLSIVTILLKIGWDYARCLQLRKRMPPGPLPLPLIGNWYDIPKVRPWIKFEEMSTKYNSPMITLWNGMRPVVMCNDAWTMSDLCDKRSAIYSSRPRFVMLGDLGNATDSSMLFQIYGDRWRLHRRLTHDIVGPNAVRNYRIFQADESAILVKDLMEAPEGLVMSFERFSCSVASIVDWGRRVGRRTDHVVVVATRFMQVSNMVVPGFFWAECVPALARLPSFLYSLPSVCLEAAQHFQRYFFALACEATENSEASTQEPNFARGLLKLYDQGKLTHDEVGHLTANLLGGAFDTTASALLTFVLAMLCFPEVQAKAHEELDTVLGLEPTRLPTWADLDTNKLPYINALVSEVLRWRPVAALGGVPHAPIQDDTYRGYLIPKGTAVTGNLWAIHRHPREYPDPDTFRPERFLHGNGVDGGALDQPYPNKTGHNAFGWGRRQCVGQPLGEQNLWIVIVRVLFAFNITRGLDREGKEFTPDIFAYTNNVIQRPESFPVKIVARSDRHRDLVLKEAKAARERLRKYDGETTLTLDNVP